jgi:hypothetical protein
MAGIGLPPPLPPVPTVPPTSPDNQWIRIPAWLAGLWQANSEIVVEAYDFRQQRCPFETPAKIRAKRVSQIGSQTDSKGSVWHYIGVPYRRTVDTGSYIDYQLIDQITLVNSTENEVTVKTSSKVTRMDKQSSEILGAFREISLTTYTPLDINLIQVTFDVNDYDMVGRPMFSSKDVCIERRTKPFKVTDQDERGDLSQKFGLFLMRNGLFDLLPGAH